MGAGTRPEPGDVVGVSITLPISGPSVSGAIELTGTTTFGAEAVDRLVARHAVTDGGTFEGSATLQREPTNPVDPDAVLVLVEGERIGYLPSYAAQLIDLSNEGSIALPVQLFTTRDERRRWTRAWVWLDQTEPRWDFSESNRPPLTSAEKRVAQARQTRAMVDEALADGGARAQEFQAGMVDGVHYLELVEPIQELKRQGRLEEALALCYKAIEGAEGNPYGGMPAPFYTEQAAIVLRKLARRDEEVAVLQRWLAHLTEDRRAQTALGQRLAKLEAKPPRT
jgi:hypothetical protein